MLFLFILLTPLRLVAQPRLQAPADGAVNVTVPTVIDWTAVTGANGYDYQVLLGNTIVFENTGGPILATSVKLDLDYATRYRWRTRARVLVQNNPWSSYWSFTTVPLVPPAQAAPASGAVGVAVPVTLRWGSLAGSTGYEYKVLRGSDVVAWNAGKPILATSVTLDLDYDATFTWQVRGRVAPQDNPWSPIWTFKTAALVPPALVAPGNGALNVPARVTLDWAALAGSSGYEYRVFRGQTEVAGNAGQPILGTSVTLNLDYGENYAWQVRGRVAAQNNPWSELWSFRTVVLVPPQLKSPVNGASGLLSTVTLDWAELPGSSGYEYRVLKSGVEVAGNAGHPILATTVTLDLDYASTYEWQVRGRVAEQNNPWSPLWSFRTGDLTPPKLVYPTSGASGTPANLTLRWARLAGSSGYEYRVINRGVVVAGNPGAPILATSVSLNLSYGETYTWQVRGRVADQNNPWSALWTFQTAPLTPPVQVAPAEGAAGLLPAVTLKWDRLPGSSGYEYRVLSSGNIVASNAGKPIPETWVTLPLDFGGAYSWQVRGRVAPQNNPWSPLRTFSTAPPPTAPVLLFPAASLTTVSPFSFSWRASFTASSSVLEIWRGGSLFRRFSDLQVSEYEVSLAPGSYQWQVRCQTAVGELKSPMAAFRVTAAANATLTPEFDAPRDGGSFLLGEAVAMEVSPLGDADGSENDPEIASIDLYVNSVKIATLTSPPYKYSWLPSAAGTYALSARVNGRERQFGLSQTPVVIDVVFCPDCPRILAHPADQPVVKGRSASFTVDATATGPVQYRWQFGRAPDGATGEVVWEDIPEATEPTFSVSATDWQNEGVYRAVVQNGAKQSVSREARLSLVEDGVDTSDPNELPDVNPIMTGTIEENGLVDVNLSQMETAIGRQASLVEEAIAPPPSAGASAPLLITAIGSLPDGTIMLRVNCQSGCKVQLLGSEDLESWSVMGEMEISNGQIVISPIIGRDGRFFQLKSLD